LTETASGPGITVSNLIKQFGRFAALRGVTAQFASGKLYAILGDSGAGIPGELPQPPDSAELDSRYQAFADGVDGGIPVQQEMERGGQLAGAPGGYTYRAQAPATRPAADYTARVIPHCDGVAIPLEEARILWQR